MTIKTAAIAFAAMSSFGVALPAAAWLANQAPEGPLAANSHLAIDVEIAPSPAAPAIPAQIVPQVLQEMTITAPAPQRAAAAPTAVMRCTDHKSETLAAGTVRICDVERSDSGHHGAFFEGIDKPNRLSTNRGLDSPSGLLR
jgi:hypothetical protein